MMSIAAATEVVQGLAELEKLEHGPNVSVTRMMGVRLIRSSIPLAVRKELNQAVKAGTLGHLKKDGLKPEAYFHPNGRANAIDARSRAAMEAIESIRKVLT